MKSRILDMLRGGEFVSGESMSERLGISRSAVWKHIGTLRSEGYGIESVTRRGYRLVSSPDILDPDSIIRSLDTVFIGRKILLFDETDSTNNEAKRKSDCPDGTLFLSDMQTGGKGRLGRAWSSPKGEGIWMSLLLKPPLAPADVPQITLIAGIAAARAIGFGARIKWPNDVVIGTKKVCGILTEMSAEIERVDHVVCGVGMNVNTPSFDGELADKATSLLIETGERHERAPVITRFLNEFERLYLTFLDGGFAPAADEYRELCLNVGREVNVIYPDREIRGRAVDINDSGELLVETENEIIAVSSGEVSVRGVLGYI